MPEAHHARIHASSQDGSELESLPLQLGQLFLTVCCQPWPSYVGPLALQFAEAGTIPVAATTTTTVGWPSTKPRTWVPPQRHTVKINLATPRPPLPIWHGEVLGGLAVR